MEEQIRPSGVTTIGILNLVICGSVIFFCIFSITGIINLEVGYFMCILEFIVNSLGFVGGYALLTNKKFALKLNMTYAILAIVSILLPFFPHILYRGCRHLESIDPYMFQNYFKLLQLDKFILIINNSLIVFISFMVIAFLVFIFYPLFVIQIVRNEDVKTFYKSL